MNMLTATHLILAEQNVSWFACLGAGDASTVVVAQLPTESTLQFFERARRRILQIRGGKRKVTYVAANEDAKLRARAFATQMDLPRDVEFKTAALSELAVSRFFAEQRSPIDAQDFGSRGLVSADRFDHARDVSTLDLVERS